MRHSVKTFLSGALIFAMALSVVVSQQSVATAKKKIALSSKKITLEKGKKKTVKIKNAKGKKLKWSIKKKSIATFKKSGKYSVKVTGKKKGTTTLICRYKKSKNKWKSLKCKVVVENKKPSSSNIPNVKTSAKPASNKPGTVSSKEPSSETSAVASEKPTPTATPTATPTVTPTATPTPKATPTPTPFVEVEYKTASFESGTDGFIKRGDATLTVVEGGHTGKALSVSNRTDNWHGASLIVTDTIVKKATYHFVAWVKQSSGTAQTIKLTAQLDVTGSDSTYPPIASSSCPNGEWTKIEGDYEIPSDFSALQFYFEGANGTYDFLVDDVTITQTTPGKEVIDPMSLPSIKDAYADLFPHFGNVVAYNQTWNNRKELQDEATMQYFKKQYNSFTLENEMKPNAILSDWSGTISVANAKSLGYVIPNGYEETTVPKLNFDNIDATLEKAKQYGIQMRAHVLMWHQQTATRFFKVGYDDKGTDVVTPEVMDARIEFFVKTVMKHVLEKEKSLTGKPGSLVYCWDVTNEYTHRDNESDKPTWVDVYGDMGLQPTYVKLAYRCAYEQLKEYGIQDDVTLFYNDYNEYDVTDQIIELVSYINEGEEANICGGIGMQSHMGIVYPSAQKYGETLDKFLNTGLEVQVTELDIGIDDGKDEEDQATRYKEIMSLIVKKQRERDTAKTKGITGVTIWGLYDSISWRKDSPLLSGTGLGDPKPAYYALLEAAK